MSRERNVGGLWCSDVLGRLSDFVDGQLPSDEVKKVEAHVMGCSYCERFGGEFSAVLTQLRERLGPAEELDSDVERRLFERLGELES